METPDFESIKQVNVSGHAYWSARDLAPLLGYHTQWQNFERAIRDAMIAAQEGGLNLDGNFTVVSKVSGARGPRQKDYFLSKRACYLVAQNADPRKSEVAAAMNYFAFAAEIVDDFTRLRLEQEKRLQLRLKVAQANTTLAETALNSGVQSKNMPIFQDAGYIGQYHMTENQLAVFWFTEEWLRLSEKFFAQSQPFLCFFFRMGWGGLVRWIFGKGKKPSEGKRRGKWAQSSLALYDTVRKSTSPVPVGFSVKGRKCVQV